MIAAIVITGCDYHSVGIQHGIAYMVAKRNELTDQGWR